MSMDIPALELEGVKTRLQEFAGWHLEEGELCRTFSFPTYADGVAFAVKVALFSEKVGHHPTLVLAYRRVTLKVSSHDAGGITERDFEFVNRVSSL
ncbi:MAG TPA: 4a-hydroxytetrahydrobiopterin dehydratase [Deinococcales bacterium]|nr:4a-hydroxytetrahydrobiopterin dehydratase [Deinococcales bacterium]